MTNPWTHFLKGGSYESTCRYRTSLTENNQRSPGDTFDCYGFRCAKLVNPSPLGPKYYQRRIRGGAWNYVSPKTLMVDHVGTMFPDTPIVVGGFRGVLGGSND